ncbi:MAG: cytochrome c-type biogenesis protein CcmH [Hyphomicrobiaceae bacterium]
MRRALLATVLAIAVSSGPIRALEPGERLADPALEARARALSAELRCLVCQNQSIDDSDAPLARDLRHLVRERLVAGDTDARVKTFVVERYGEFVLLKPPVGLHTLLLWLTPVLALLAVAAVLVRGFRNRQRAAANAPEHARSLTDEERNRLASLMDEPAEH